MSSTCHALFLLTNVTATHPEGCAVTFSGLAILNSALVTTGFGAFHRLVVHRSIQFGVRWLFENTDIPAVNGMAGG